MHCFHCKRYPGIIDEYVEAAQARDVSPDVYVMYEEGTYNRHAQTFCCTSCYVALGCPSAPGGWKAPHEQSGPCPRCGQFLFAQYYHEVDIGVGVDRVFLGEGACNDCGALRYDPEHGCWVADE